MFAIRLMLCVGVATVLSQALPLQRSYCVPLAIAVVLNPDLDWVSARALQSGVGTVIGASVGSLILAARPPEPLLVIWLAHCSSATLRGHRAGLAAGALTSPAPSDAG
jgi:uncharacterized membrane protein YccC